MRLLLLVLLVFGCSSIPMKDCERRCWPEELHLSVLEQCGDVPTNDYTSPDRCRFAENLRYHGCRARCTDGD
jgi:hypothetical protein